MRPLLQAREVEEEGREEGGEAHLLGVVERQQREIERLRRRVACLERGVGGVGESEGVGYRVGREVGVEAEQALKLALPALVRGWTSMHEVQRVRRLCEQVVGEGVFGGWKDVMRLFFEHVVGAREGMCESVALLEAELSDDWYKEPWYLLYVQRMGVDAPEEEAGFDRLRSMLPYIRSVLGFRNLCLLPHYESPMGDGGYDISAFCPREALGGEQAFQSLIKETRALGMRVATDAVFNHTSTEHEWFQRALRGEEKYLRYYVQRNGREKIAEWDRDGDIVCRYRDADGTLTERVVVFPDVDRTHGLWVEIRGNTYQFYRSFYPFQVDLNLQNPDVLGELFRVLAEELKMGVMAKRMDAVAHWIKRAGTSGEGLPECHAVLALIKSFVKHVNAKAILMPEVVRDMGGVGEYLGNATNIMGSECGSEGDAVWNFEIQAALREATYFQTVAPWWRGVFRMPKVEEKGVWMNVLEHHDETYMGYFGREVRVWMAEYIKSHKGIVYKNGMSAGVRLADCLNENEERIATALFLLFVTPGVPMVYMGTEIGAKSDREHAERMQERAVKVFEELGLYVDKASCFDGRELQRGGLARASFDKAVATNYKGLWIVKRMNELWRKSRWLREGDPKPMDTGDIAVLCMGRATNDKSERVMCLGNLAEAEKWAAVPKKQVAEHWGLDGGEDWTGRFEFVDVLTGRNIELVEEIAAIRFRLSGYDRAIAKIVKRSNFDQSAR
eukprot:GFKZ01012978.1.p1 GENE.GFKZ01012978.1~~GFKZ01012978.1.p1  ORF type:complete len:730 (-),score=131.91 GFKZ01012978.1:614-2803(-)